MTIALIVLLSLGLIVFAGVLHTRGLIVVPRVVLVLGGLCAVLLMFQSAVANGYAPVMNVGFKLLCATTAVAMLLFACGRTVRLIANQDHPDTRGKAWQFFLDIALGVPLAATAVFALSPTFLLMFVVCGAVTGFFMVIFDFHIG